jgi:DNA-directed RNA polymerase specialized sigma24 family protein
MTVLGPIPERGVGEIGGGEPRDASFVAFAREQHRSLLALAWTLTGDLGAAEEVAQDVLHATWQAWSSGDINRLDSWARSPTGRSTGVRRAGRERRALERLAAEPGAIAALPTTDHEFWGAVRACRRPCRAWRLGLLLLAFAGARRVGSIR